MSPATSWGGAEQYPLASVLHPKRTSEVDAGEGRQNVGGTKNRPKGQVGSWQLLVVMLNASPKATVQRLSHTCADAFHRKPWDAAHNGSQPPEPALNENPSLATHLGAHRWVPPLKYWSWVHGGTQALPFASRFMPAAAQAQVPSSGL